MALLIKVTHAGEPVSLAPVELFFDGIRRYERHTDKDGEIRFEPCPGADVHVAIDGKRRGVYSCREGGTVTVEV
jgi:hypothetical protein